MRPGNMRPCGENGVSVHLLTTRVSWEFITGHGRSIRGFGEQVGELLRGAAGGAAADAGVGFGDSGAAGDDRGDAGVHAHAFLPGEVFHALADGARELDAEGAHGDGSNRRYCRGVTMEMPRDSQPGKSAALEVTMHVSG
jgi:hypothetical protein